MSKLTDAKPGEFWKVTGPRGAWAIYLIVDGVWVESVFYNKPENASYVGERMRYDGWRKTDSHNNWERIG
jgi:hypothetical protein